MKIIAPLLVILLMLLSCEKDELMVDEDPQRTVENTEVPLICKELSEDGIFKEYTCHDRNLLQEEKSRFLYTSYTYNAYNQLITADYYLDLMHHPFQSISRLLTPGIFTNANNIVKQIYTLHFEVDAFIEKVQVREYAYEYNDLGYPVKKSG
jgi:hypothetical protein